MKDESKIVYVGQQIGTTTVVSISKQILYEDRCPDYLELQTVDIVPENLRGYEVWIAFKCSCGEKVNRCLRALVGKAQPHTPCALCSTEISKNKKAWKEKHHPKPVPVIKAKVPRINTLPSHILAAHKIYHPGVEWCLKLLELFPMLPENWAIRKLHTSAPMSINNLFVENIEWRHTKYKECREIEENFKPSCTAKYLGKGKYEAICRVCGKRQVIPHSNLYSKHKGVNFGEPTKRKCKCIPRVHVPKTEQELDNVFVQGFAGNNTRYELLSFTKTTMQIKHKSCGTVSEVRKSIRTIVSKCPVCTQEWLNGVVKQNLTLKFGGNIELVGNYKGKVEKSEYRCAIGHRFQSHYRSLRMQTGCPRCADNITDLTKPMILYYIRVNTAPPLYKIGITKNEVKQRFKRDKASLITELRIWKYELGQDAYDREQAILEQYKEFKYNGEKVLRSEGNTELFTKDVLGLDK